MKKAISGIFFIFIAYAGYGQEHQIEVSGNIVDAETQEPVPYVHVMNKGRGKGVVSNTEGRFWITVDKKDTILFSSIGFEPYAFTIKDRVTTDKLIVTIEMNTSTLELQPVKVFAYRDEKALKQAMLNMDVPIEKENPALIIPGLKQSKHTTPSGGVSIGGPFTALYNSFSKEAKERRKLQHYKKEYDYQLLIKEKYNESVVIDLTGLPEDKVADFMEFCKLPDSFIERSTEYEIAVAINHCLIDFVNLDTEEK